MDKKQMLIEIGQKCSNNRIKSGIKLEEVALELGYTKETIAGFEKGRNNNLYIFLWYLRNGYYEL